MRKVYKPKRDFCYTSLFAVGLVLCASISVLSEIFLDSTMRHIIPVILGLLAVLVTLLFVRVKYIVDENYCTIIFGFITFKFKKKDIIFIKQVNKLTKSFSLSKKCLLLSFGKDDTKKFNKIYLSPKDENGFLKEFSVGGEASES